MANALYGWWCSGKARWDFLKVERAYQSAFSQKLSSLLLCNMGMQKNNVMENEDNSLSILPTMLPYLVASLITKQQHNTIFN